MSMDTAVLSSLRTNWENNCNRPVATFQGKRITRERIWSTIGYEPHAGNSNEGSQWHFHYAPERFKVAACGRRYGKSNMSGMDVIDYLFIPNARGWIVGESYGTGEEEFAYIEEAVKTLITAFGLPSKQIQKAHNLRTGEMYIRMPWNARVEVRSWKHPDSLVGKGLSWVIYAEAAKLPRIVHDKYIRGALADHRAPALFPSTPEGDNWFKEFHDFGNEKQLAQGQYWEDSWRSWNFPSWENPILYPLGFDDPEIKSQMGTPGGTPYFWQEIGAKFNVFVGQIYPQFTKETHVLSVDNYPVAA